MRKVEVVEYDFILEFLTSYKMKLHDTHTQYYGDKKIDIIAFLPGEAVSSVATSCYNRTRFDKCLRK